MISALTLSGMLLNKKLMNYENGDEILSTQSQARRGETTSDAAIEVGSNDKQTRTPYTDEPVLEPTLYEQIQQEPLIKIISNSSKKKRNVCYKLNRLSK